MAGEFVIEALEPRQLLSCSASPAATSAVAAAVVVSSASSSASTSLSQTVVTNTAATVVTGSTSTATATMASMTTAATTTTATTAFVRPGDSDDSNAPPTGSQFGWGTDIYPPPAFNGSGQETSRATVTVGPAAPTTTSSSSNATTTSTASTSSTSTTTPPPTKILIGRRVGKSHLAKHFSVRPNIEESRPARGSTGSAAPPAIAPTTVHPMHIPAGTFPVAAGSSTLTSASNRTFSPPASTSTNATGLADLASFVATSAPAASIHAMPVLASAANTVSPADAAAPANAAARALRLLPRPDLSGLLLPLATMDTDVVGNAGATVSKWEVDVALGSLTVVLAGYCYLADAAARRRRQRALAVSVFCDKSVE